MKKSIKILVTVTVLIIDSFLINILNIYAADPDWSSQPTSESCNTAILLGDEAATGTNHYYPACVTLSPGGKEIIEWVFDANKKLISKKNYYYMAKHDIGTSMGGGINFGNARRLYQETFSHDYQSNKDNTNTRHYIAVEQTDYGSIDNLEVPYDWDSTKKKYIGRTQPDTTADPQPGRLLDYKAVIGNGLPDYKNPANSTRFIINGTAKVNNKTIVDGRAGVIINDKNGPPLDYKEINDDGSFEFSYSGVNSDIWINRDKVNKIYLYVQGKDSNNNKYEDYIELSGFSNSEIGKSSSDFRWYNNDSSSNAVVLDSAKKNIDLSESKKVNDFNRASDTTSEAGGGSGTGTGSSSEECGSSYQIGGAILVGFCNITIMVKEWALSLLCYAQDKLVEVLGQQSLQGGAGCTNNLYKQNSTMQNLLK